MIAPLTLRCLKCHQPFESSDKATNRICARCKGSFEWRTAPDWETPDSLVRRGGPDRALGRSFHR